MKHLLTMGLDEMAPVAVVLVIFAMIFVIQAARWKREIKSIVVGESELLAKRHSGGVVRMPWSQLREVLLVVKEPDPLDDDVSWVLIAEGGRRLKIRSDIPDSDQLLRRLQLLPGFDSSAVAEAFCSVWSGKHHCWKRQEA